MVIDLRTCTVIGGRGFIGRSLVQRLLKLGDWIVRIADSDDSLRLDHWEENSPLSEALSANRASYFHVDVRNKSQLIKAIEGSSVVFYVETTTSFTDDFYDCYTLIVKGAKNVINACRECKVKQLIYNSTADVVFDGLHDIHNGDESLLYAWKFKDMLSDLKAQAEALVLFANDVDGLLTCALRPSNVFGPGDTEIIPFVVNQAKSGWAKLIIGSGENISDFTYVENVAHALMCAEKALGSRMVSVSGKAFFITNLEPVKFSEFVSLILEDLGYQRPMVKLPARLVKCVVSLVKWVHTKTASGKLNHSIPLHNVVKLALCTSTFSCSAAKKHIGYSPVVSLENDLDHMVAVADILLWRDEKTTFACFLAVALLYHWFFFSGRTFISSAAKLLLLVTGALTGYGILPSNIFGFSIPRISASSFEISEVDMTNSAKTIVHMWNRGAHVIKALAQGEDWNLFFQVAVPLYFLELIVSRYLTAAIGVGVALAFSMFFVYQQYEEEIDGIAKVLMITTKEAMGLVMNNLPAPLTSFLHKPKEDE
ncbi:hypothetical protein RHGRI_025620 [Rhododendron griersonianum]|uniref:Reticulon-like protein n=1 Tax=Rhododendron griersonianum TaxID=479676 RepID=A0AAV6IPY3_9ERIC|nr:hypothetical protein RHGRI_025620 [Rhododendron griersonianum]